MLVMLKPPPTRFAASDGSASQGHSSEQPEDRTPLHSHFPGSEYRRRAGQSSSDARSLHQSVPKTTGRRRAPSAFPWLGPVARRPRRESQDRDLSGIPSRKPAVEPRPQRDSVPRRAVYPVHLEATAPSPTGATA